MSPDTLNAFFDELSKVSFPVKMLGKTFLQKAKSPKTMNVVTTAAATLPSMVGQNTESVDKIARIAPSQLLGLPAKSPLVRGILQKAKATKTLDLSKHFAATKKVPGNELMAMLQKAKAGNTGLSLRA